LKTIATEISQEHKKQIEEIIEGMECPKDFECYKPGFESLCKARIIRDGKLVECPDEQEQACHFRMPIGFGSFCKCQL